MPGINFDLYVGRHLISILLALKEALVTYSFSGEMNQRFSGQDEALPVSVSV